MSDGIGRIIEDSYENRYLISISMVNDSIETYGYDTRGWMKEITDANGRTYVHNEYDREGRVTRQTLINGQEQRCIHQLIKPE